MRKVSIGLLGLKGVNEWLYLPALKKHPWIEITGGCENGVRS